MSDSIERRPSSQLVIRILIIAVAAVVFAVDALMPLGVAGAVPYVLAVWLASTSGDRRTIGLTVVGTIALAILGALLSGNVASVDRWIYTTNRVLAVLAILVVAGTSWWAPPEDQKHSSAFPKLSFLAPLLTVLIVTGTYWLSGAQLVSLQTHLARDQSILILRGEILHLDEVLAMSARMSAVTGDQHWEQRYLQHEPRLSAALDRLQELAVEAELAASQETVAANQRLLEIETAAFDYVRVGDTASALGLLTSHLYQNQQRIYTAGMSDLLDALQHSSAQRFDKDERRAGYQFITASVATAICLLIWVATIRTMSRWRLSEEAARAKAEQARQRLDFALTGANIGLWNWDIQDNIVEFSPTAKTQLGYRADDDWSTLDDWESKIHPDDRESARQTVNAYLNRETEDYESVYRMQCADHSYRWIMSLGRARFDPCKRPSQMIGVHVDITERKRQEQTLSELNLSLAKSNEELEQFAYVASHDLQEPLRKVSMFCELLELEHGDSLDSEGRQFLTFVVDSAARMRTLIQDLLEFSRVKTSEIDVRETDAVQSLEEAIHNLERAIDESAMQITHDELPTINADRRQLTQLFQNLIGNAIKYRSDQRPKVHVGIESSDDGWRFSVADNGIGIDPAFRNKVFGVFKRLHSREEYPGTGIGLAICKRIVDQLGGNIWVEPNRRTGSVFCFTIPK